MRRGHREQFYQSLVLGHRIWNCIEAFAQVFYFPMFERTVDLISDVESDNGCWRVSVRPWKYTSIHAILCKSSNE